MHEFTHIQTEQLCLQEGLTVVCDVRHHGPPADIPQVPSAIERMEAAVSQPGGVADVVQVSGSDGELSPSSAEVGAVGHNLAGFAHAQVVVQTIRQSSQQVLD